jgi:hypothetical protein
MKNMYWIRKIGRKSAERGQDIEVEEWTNSEILDARMVDY